MSHEITNINNKRELLLPPTSHVLSLSHSVIKTPILCHRFNGGWGEGGELFVLDMSVVKDEK